MTSHVRRVRLLFGAAALAASFTTSLACSDDSGSAQPTITDGAGSTVVLTVPADPVAALQQALAGLDAGYHLVATVTINGAVSLQAEGDRVGANSRLAITSAGNTVSYVITAEGNYAKPTDGDWELLDVAPATSDPIDALRAPVAVTALDTTDGSLQLKVTVTAVSLGIQAEGNVDVMVTITGGRVTTIAYDATVQGGTATVTTVISELLDTTPITAPNV